MPKIEEINDMGDRYKIKADGLTYSAWEKDTKGKAITAFKQITDKKFRVGDSVELVYFENPGKTRSGEDTVYKNVTEIKPLSEEKQKEEKSEIPKAAPVDWDAKDRRITRQACLKVAVQLIVKNIVGEAEPDMEKFSKSTIKVAKEFEKYVYEKKED